VWLTILSLLAVIVPITAAGASTDTTAEVSVYFTPAGSECDVSNPYTRTVPTPAVLRGALEQLLAGPTAEERPWTATEFSAATAGMLRSVNIRDGVAHIDFADLRTAMPNASAACGSASLLAQLNATAEQFPTVHRARYSINGSEATFYNWLQRGVPGRSTVTRTRGSLANTATIQRTDGTGGTLRKVRVGRHDGFDRMVFEFDGGRPSYTIGYTAVPRTGGAGAPIPVGGNTALQIDLGASTIDMEVAEFPRTFSPEGPLVPRFPTLRQLHHGGEFEGLSTFAAGLRARTGFRVLELSNPTRLAIDVAHGATVRRLWLGKRGADVRDWQEQLNTVQYGFFAVSKAPRQGRLMADGVFGARTERATRTFQIAEGLSVTDVVDSATRRAMRRALRRTATIRP
jgi:hypothetical protein